MKARAWAVIGLIGIVLTVFARATLAAEPARGDAVPVRVSVDPRVELMCVIFRLAGNQEYGKGRIASYNRDVDEHFGPHKDHPAVQLAAQLREKSWVSYDAVMSMAVHVSDAYGLRERVPFEPRPARLDSRWNPDEAREFLEKTRHFVQSTRFEEFFHSHGPLYEQTAARAREFLQKEVHLEWLRAYFNTVPNASYHVVPGMLNGSCSYGVRFSDGQTAEFYCVLGVADADRRGVPQFPRRQRSTVIHEFCHSYANPMVDKHAEELRAAGETLFPRVEPQLKSMAYGNWRTMMYESLVRACEVRCVAAHEGEVLAQVAIWGHKAKGFPWIGGLSKLLEEDEARRDEYPTLAAFFPRIVAFFNEYAESPPPNESAMVPHALLAAGPLMVLVGLGFAIGWKVRSRVRWRWFWAGAAIWAVGVALKFAFAVPLNKPVLGSLKAALPDSAYLFLGSLYVGLLTGVFEIGVTLAAGLIWRGMARKAARAVAVGLGAGGIEAILVGLGSFVGVLVALSGVSGSEQAQAAIASSTVLTSVAWLVGPVERVLAVLCHTSSRALVLLGIAKHRWRYFWFGFLIMTAIDAIAGYAHIAGLLGRISLWWVELAIAPFAVASVLIILWCLRNWPAEDAPLSAA
ncbi:MAG: YhfC family glutamic-type intramembrane protease [Planctomycetota bacterium]|jgi:uncharacterized membrane protein YhfC